MKYHMTFIEHGNNFAIGIYTKTDLPDSPIIKYDPNKIYWIGEMMWTDGYFNEHELIERVFKEFK